MVERINQRHSSLRSYKDHTEQGELLQIPKHTTTVEAKPWVMSHPVPSRVRWPCRQIKTEMLDTTIWSFSPPNLYLPSDWQTTQCMCICKATYMCGHASGDPKLISSVLLYHFPLSTLRKGLSLNPECISSGSCGSLALGIPCLSPRR